MAIESTRAISNRITRGMLPQGYELTDKDVGTLLSYWDGFGVVLQTDVGKRVWVRSYGLVMENDAQRNRRKF